MSTYFLNGVHYANKFAKGMDVLILHACFFLNFIVVVASSFISFFDVMFPLFSTFHITCKSGIFLELKGC